MTGATPHGGTPTDPASLDISPRTPSTPGTGPDGSHEADDACPYCDGEGTCHWDVDPHGCEPLTLDEAGRFPFRTRVAKCVCGAAARKGAA